MLSERDAQRLAEMPMTYHATLFPVQVAGLTGEIAAWVFAPPSQALSATPLVLDLYPGWAHDKRYWNFVPNAMDGSYSCAQYLCEHYCCVVIASDHLGTGESTKPANGFGLTLDVLAEAHAQVADQVRTRLHTGTFTPDLPPLPAVHLGAIGHGMGALILQRVQARFQPYDLIGLLGWTHSEPQYGNVDPAALEETFQPNAQGYVAMRPAERRALRPFFYGPSVPPEIVEADEQQESVLPGGLAADLVLPGAAQADAASITVPVFLGYGEQDVSRNPSEDAACYPNAASVTTSIQPYAAHCHSLAPTRHLLWKAIGWWLQRLAAHGFTEVISDRKDQNV